MKSLKIKRNNKKAVSEVISYVLLIVIAMSLATGVYAWMKFYVPSEKEEKCADDTAISVIDYKCVTYGGQKYIRLTILNQGFFEVDGFFITASNDIARPPFESLNSSEPAQLTSGRYNFFIPDKLKPGASKENIEFKYPRYQNGTEWSNIKRVKIQPFKAGTKALLACPYIAEIRPENC